MNYFGPLASASQLEASAKTALQTWLHTYLGQAERDLGRPVQSIPRPRSWQKTAGDPAEIHERAIPRIIIRSPGINGEPEADGEGYSAWWTLGIAGIVREIAEDDKALDLARDYAAAVRRCFIQKPPAVAQAVRWIDEDYTILASNRERTTVGFELVFEVLVDDITDYGPGPVDPEPPQHPDPPIDYGDLPEVEETDVTVEHDEEITP